MSEQGDRPGRPTAEDDWWNRLYDDSARDTGPGPTRPDDTLDTRFASAPATTSRPRAWWDDPPPPPGPTAGAPPPGTMEAPPAPGASPPPVGADVPPPDATSAPPHEGRPPGPDAPVPPSGQVPAREVPGADVPPRGAMPDPPGPGGAAPAAPPTRGRVPDPRAAASGGPPKPPGVDAPAPAGAGGPRPRVGVVGGGPPTYEAEPTALPAAEALALEQLVADTVLDGARYGTYTLRAASVRGDSARYRGEPRGDALLTARFGTGPAALVLVALASGGRHTENAHLAAADATRWIGTAVGRSHTRLAEDIRAGRRADLKSGLHRLTDRGFGRLRARAAELGLEPEQYTAGLRCLLLSADPDCRTRVFFGVGDGGLFRLRDGAWQDIEPLAPEKADPDPPPAEPFRFRASVARPGDTLLLCSNGLAEPLRGEPALAAALTERWDGPEPPGMTQFLADIQLRVKGYADDRTAVAVWEA
ncbi:protein phosphatase 2C domain-containing protein [Streptomyces sp. NPDC015127]|uniref:protein phosphatase 2C domain-containing protein n=1 Tax=Streptomyces sp. NPDC015127 TaxID=3364939 RepID=UPI0036F88BA3